MTRFLSGVKGMRKALEQRSRENYPVLILEYVDGETLRDHSARKKLDLRSRLEIAVEITRILGKIHKHDIVHLNVNSENILIGKKPPAVSLIDLGAAVRLDVNVHLKVGPDQMLGNLPYISPEQTGRINRALDERSDLYSLGVILYELMTGELPFDSEDPAELIHHHISRVPAPPSEVSRDIPEVISSIIMKLLRKNAEDRYQSASGARADLEECLQRLRPDNTIEEFTPGESDHTSRFIYPQKLYGRGSESQELSSALDSAFRQTSSMILVSGYSGIGKTALVEEVQRPVSERRGYFVRGKFDQYLRSTPYSGFAQAFAAFVSQILTEPESIFKELQESVQSAVGDLGRVLIDVIPDVEELMGPQPHVPQLWGQDSEKRFDYVFINFLSAAATEERPLVLFIDDLQWIDTASLRLLKVIQADFNQPGLLVIGAYRDNEVDAAHPLMEFITEEEKKGKRPRILKLDNLQRQSIDMLLTDTLRTQKGIKELGATIYEKTLGNPFFARRLLSSLNQEGSIRYDSEMGGWTWDIEGITAKAIAENVAGLLAETIAKLPDQAKHILSFAACLGTRFDVPTVARVSGLEDQELIELLTATVTRQYVAESGDAYEFVHDQVQQAAYTLIDAESRAKRHLEIGRLLLADTEDSELEERIFEIVNQYNQGIDLLTDQAEIIRLAELNLQAGLRSRASSAFSASVEYLRQSASLLGENRWQDHYKLTLDVYNGLIAACYLTIQNDEVKTLFDTIRRHVKQDVDLGAACKTMIMSNIAENELAEAISLAEDYLEKLRIPFENARSSSLSVDELFRLPPMKDREKLAAMEILMVITTPVIFSAPERVPLVIYTMLNIISEYGNCAVSSYAYNWYAIHLCLMQQYHEGNIFGQLGVDLLEKYPYPGMAARIMDLQYAWVRHWKLPVHDLIEPLKFYYRVGMEEGDFEWGLYCLLNYTLLLWGTGEHLDVYISEAEPGISQCEHKNQEIALLMFLLFAQSAHNLTGRSAHTKRLEGKWFSEENMMSRLAGNHMLLALYGQLKMTLCYLFGTPQEAYQYIEETLKYRDSLNPHYLYTKISFYGGLSCAAGLAGAGTDADKKDCLKKLELFEKELELWTEVAPMNFQHEYHLLRAEKSRVGNSHWEAIEFYEKAIKGAQENRFVHEEALANELYACFWQNRGNDKLAEVYMHEAHTLYDNWGATAKVRQIENLYPQWFKTRAAVDGHTVIPLTAETPTTQTITSVRLDLDDIIRASQALSSETDRTKLLVRMMDLAIANSGADRAVLLLRQGADWFVQALGDSTTSKYEIFLNRRFGPHEGDSETALVPEPLFDYCRRSKKILVVGDAQTDRHSAEDRTVKARNIRSMIGIPILSQGELSAMLYLENCHMADVFALDRVEVLKHLASQFGVSVENALLYEDLNRKVLELQKSEERYELALAASAAGIWDWDIQTDRVFFSDRFKELLGYEPEEFSDSLGEFWNRLHSDDYGLTQEAVERHLKEQVPYLVDYRLQTKSGEYRWFHARAQAIWDETGEPTRMSGSITDITERKQAEEEARRQREALARIDRTSSMGQLTGSIAHELNQPLTGILSNAQAAELMIRRGRASHEDLAEIVAEIVADTKRASDVIRNLRDLYREQQGELLPVDINAVIDETIQLLHSELVMQDVALAKECTPSVPLVKGSKVQIQQVLVNLIMNSIQAMSGAAQDDRRLRVRTESNANEVKVWAEDRGPGIDENKIDRIFEPLATWKPGGTGMGLAISNSIIEAHGGRMWAENRPEGGARVGFVLPVLKENQQV